ncbi:MAG: Glycerophosphoryl diester phosphodiesterase [Marmoricola sp.]|nr:Glycerophosphoryl diester phosphodiesterase [Marmoricola sp.]
MSSALVIGHRGASGHRPEHTALAYRLAFRAGADSVEPDVLSTRDGVLVCRHDLDLSLTTDIAERPEFAGRRRTHVVEGTEKQGWFVHDLDLAELRTLRARERWPRKRPGSARFDGHVGVLTLEELLDLREEESARAGRELGVHVELKHAEHQAALGLPLDEPLVDLLRRRRHTSPLSPVTVMGFESSVLRSIRHEVDVDLVQLVDHPASLKRSRLARVASYATGVGLHKDHVLPRDDQDQVGAPGKAVAKAIGAGLDVLVWTLRSENRHLPANLRSPGSKRAHGAADQEVHRMLDAGVDGLLTDFPAVAVDVCRSRVESTRFARTS